jgi:large subunit ribosomal protein L13
MEKSTLLKNEDITSRNWFLLDASNKTLGRFASEVAKILRGKHKPNFTPHIDSGDGVIIINAEKIKVSGAKEARKVYYHYTGFIGGLKSISYRQMKEEHPDRIILRTVKGMMPRTRLGRKQMTRLRVFAGEKHLLEAQKPIVVNI